MAVTIVGRWHVPAGKEDVALAAARQELAARGAQPAARREAHIFQAIADPGTLLYVGEWADRAAFELYRADNGPGAVEQAVRDGGEYVICERLVFFGRFAYRAQVIACGIVEAPLEATEEIRQLVVPSGRWTIHGWPGLVHYTVFREITHSHRYVVVHGWQSEAALREFRESRGGEFRETLDRLGATLIQFVGRERASTELF
jgi:quinol monooxygenase YgiN